MPELPEIETLKRSLATHIIGRKILSLTKFRNSLRYDLDPKLTEKTKNALITNARRIAKYLILELNNNYSLTFHLGMSGRLVLREPGYQFQKHDHLALLLDNNRHLVFNDARRFGMVYICFSDTLTLQKYLHNLGPEPFDKGFSTEYLLNAFKNKKTPIKSAIMDNRILVGVGNIYASESLFLSRINPLKPAAKLVETEIDSLIKSIIIVLEKAIEAGGTTLRDFVNGDNKPGYFKQELNVYDRKNEQCTVCNAKILKIAQSGRATYYCPECQR